jgi:hypothetical protein
VLLVVVVVVLILLPGCCASVTGAAARYPFFPTATQTRGQVLELKVRSRGYDDPCLDDGFTGLSKCNSAIVVNGKATALSRGHTIMYFDSETGELIDTGYVSVRASERAVRA